MNSITAQKLQQLLGQPNHGILLIDVRSEIEHNLSNINNSILMPLDTFNAEEIENLCQEKTKIVIYCRSGVRSATACAIMLAQKPYIDVYNLEGGILSWLAHIKQE